MIEESRRKKEFKDKGKRSPSWYLYMSTEICFVACRKPHVNVGTIGHVDHGKTTLTAAITRVRTSIIYYPLLLFFRLHPFQNIRSLSFVFYKGK